MSKRGMATVTAVVACALAGPTGLASGEGPVAGKSAGSTVNIRDFSYRPATLTVDRGTTVVFANHDSVSHTATKRGSFSTGKIKPGKSKSVRFSSKGTYRYLCTIHPEMRGKIVVD
jgi:plastocyanin